MYVFYSTEMVIYTISILFLGILIKEILETKISRISLLLLILILISITINFPKSL